MSKRKSGYCGWLLTCSLTRDIEVCLLRFGVSGIISGSKYQTSAGVWMSRVTCSPRNLLKVICAPFFTMVNHHQTSIWEKIVFLNFFPNIFCKSRPLTYFFLVTYVLTTYLFTCLPTCVPILVKKLGLLLNQDHQLMSKTSISFLLF